MSAFAKMFRCILPIVFLFAFSCHFDDEDYYKLEIISHGGTFLGTYTVDSKTRMIDPLEIQNLGGIYIYSKGLGNLVSLQVDVSAVTSDVSFLKISLYQDEQNIGSDSVKPVDGDRPLFLSYAYTAADAGEN